MVGALTVSLILGRDMSSDTFNLAGLSGAAVGTILWLIDHRIVKLNDVARSCTAG